MLADDTPTRKPAVEEAELSVAEYNLDTITCQKESA
jgi:hypothetical protein